MKNEKIEKGRLEGPTRCPHLHLLYFELYLTNKQKQRHLPPNGQSTHSFSMVKPVDKAHFVICESISLTAYEMIITKWGTRGFWSDNCLRGSYCNISRRHFWKTRAFFAYTWKWAQFVSLLLKIRDFAKDNETLVDLESAWVLVAQDTFILASREIFFFSASIVSWLQVTRWST